MSFEEHEANAAPLATETSLVVDVDGFEGPLDLLLELARRQKVDLQRISMLALAEQFLSFVEAARALRLELAADYLVMAASLAFLKSRLLLPRAEPDADQKSAEDLAAALAERLRRLALIRRAAEALEERPRLGRDTALRGTYHGAVRPPTFYAGTIYDLMSAYARQRQKQALRRVRLAKRHVLALPDARERVIRFASGTTGWFVMEDVVAAHADAPAMRRSARASTFAAALELVREGRLGIRQDGAFAPLRLKRLAS